MSQNLTHQEPACDLPDGDLIEAFLRIAESSASIGSPSLNIMRFTHATAYSGAPDRSAIIKRISINPEQASHLRTINNCSLDLTCQTPKQGAYTVNLRFNRAPQQLTIQVQSTNPQGEPHILRLVAAAYEQGLVAPRVLEAAPSPENAVLRALAEQVATFRDTINQQARHNEDIRARLDQEFAGRVATLDAENEQRIQRIKDDHKDWEAESKQRFAEREQELEQRAKELDEREQRLDLQTERDARRNLRKQIQAAAKDMFEKPDLSEQAKENFNRVKSACLWTIGGAVFFLLVAFFVPPILEIGLEKVLSLETIWLVWSMRALAGVVLVAALIYYVSSLSAWSRQVAAIELRSKQFALDIDRASWLVEMALEYEKEGKALPTPMIESFTRGLFEGGSRSVPQEQPSTSLLHLIQNAESLKVGPTGAELTWTDKKIRKADAQAAKDA